MEPIFQTLMIVDLYGMAPWCSSIYTMGWRTSAVSDTEGQTEGLPSGNCLPVYLVYQFSLGLSLMGMSARGEGMTLLKICNS